MSVKQNSGYTMDLTEGPILKKIILFSIPLVISSVLQLLFNAVDVMVVGKFAGDNALAAVGSNGPIINLITNVFMGLSLGANVLVARFFASKQDDELKKVVHTSILVSIVCGVALVVIGWFMARKLLEWTQSPIEVIDLATVYLRIYFFGMPATMVYNFGASILRGVGDTKRSLYYLTFAGVINVILNLIFVIIFRWDVVGVALATVISQTISAVLVVRCLMRDEGAYRLILKELKVDWKCLWQMIKIGVPAGIQSSMFSLSNVVVQSSINSFGNIVMAGNAAAQNIEAFLAMAVKALSQAATAFISQNVGAKKYNRINKVVITLILCVLVVDGLAGNLIYLFGHPLLSLYSDSVPVIEQGMIRIRIACTIHIIYGMMDVMAGVLRGMGHSITPMIVSLVGVCALRVVWIATIFQVPEFHTIEMLYYAYPISWAITLGAHTLYFLIVRTKLKRKLMAE